MLTFYVVRTWKNSVFQQLGKLFFVVLERPNVWSILQLVPSLRVARFFIFLYYIFVTFFCFVLILFVFLYVFEDNCKSFLFFVLLVSEKK